jgi:hypothetical protein
LRVRRSKETAGHLPGVRIADGVAYVDVRSFARDVPEASSSCGRATLLARLERTAKQCRTVSRAVYSFDGSRHSFHGWLQGDVPSGRP